MKKQFCYLMLSFAFACFSETYGTQQTGNGELAKAEKQKLLLKALSKSDACFPDTCRTSQVDNKKQTTAREQSPMRKALPQSKLRLCQTYNTAK